MSRPLARGAGRLALLVLVLLVALPAAAALAAPAPRPFVSLAAVKARGANGVEALENYVRTQAASETVSGTVHHTGAYWNDAQGTLSAIVFQNVLDPATATYGWSVVGGSEVASTGAYSVDLPGPGTYRVGFTDSAGIYKDAYYAAASTVASATDVNVATGTAVANIDETVTPAPEFIAEGSVHFVGATSADQPVGVVVYTFDSVAGGWVPLFTKLTNNDGTYRVHLPSGQTYRFGYTDNNGVFSDAYYADGSSVASATGVSVTTTGVPVTGIDQTMTAQPSSRVAGDDRFATAVALSQSQYADGFGGTVTIASGKSFADSLAGSTYALSNDGPMLLTDKAEMPAVVTDEITRLAPMQVVILGGTGVVSLEQELALRASGIPIVRRIAGMDRYDTAAQAAQELVNAGLVENNVAVANGTAFADAVAGGPVAAADGRPILFVRADSVPQATQDFLDRNTPATSLVFGGSGVVSDDVLASLPTATRLGGANRYETAANIAAYGIDTLGLNARVVNLASGTSLADGLAAGPIMGARRQVMVMTANSPLSSETESFLTGRRVVIARINAVGGSGPIDDTTFQAAVDAIK